MWYCRALQKLSRWTSPLTWTRGNPDAHAAAVQEDESIESQLQQVSTKHAERSRLADVLASLCTVLGVECEALQDGAGGSVPDEEAANDVADMDDEDEEAANDSGDEGGEDSEDAYDMAEDGDQDRTVSNNDNDEQ